jgi:hypothetical protein
LLQRDLEVPDIVRQCGDTGDRAREVPDRDRFRQHLFVIVEEFDFEIRVGQRPAQQDVILAALHVVESECRVFLQLHIAAGQDAFARRALSLLATMRQRDAVTEGGVEDGFVLLDLEFYAYRVQANDISGRAHGASSNQGLQIFRGSTGRSRPEPAPSICFSCRD